MLKDKDALDVLLAAVMLAYLAWLVYTMDERVKETVNAAGRRAMHQWSQARWAEKVGAMPGWKRELVNHRGPLPAPYLVQLSDHHIVYWSAILEG